MILRKLIGIGKMTTLALALCGASSLAGCGRSNNPGAIVAPNNSGSVSLALQVGNGTTINSATYVISGPNSFSRMGTIDLSSSTTLSATIGGLPAGTGYQIMLTATATDSTSCGGSATFNVTAHQTITVVVPMDCHEPVRTGS